jgi:ABC-type multidrug transport system ATPase subunit
MDADTSPGSTRDAARLRDAARTLLQVAGLTKRWGDETALADVAFEVHAGEIVGLIGPNGAGKTTLLEAVAGLVPVDAGRVGWCGATLPPARRRDVVFYMPDGIRPYGDQPVVRVLRFFADVYRQPTERVAAIVAALELGPVLGKRVQTLSKGFNRRLLLALALVAPHPLVLMDEPFDGFDLRQARAIADLLRRAAADGRTFVLAIHQLADAERVCDRFLLLSQGQLRGEGTLDRLRARMQLPAAHLEEIFLALT